ncbi:Integrase [Arthrobacter sp. PAMC 25486]|uniref:tyrosine-type recombinase/integrase n=1 Tax=Arthrobacter sp. PAMC 25486 TaxID=1494608 RepID=UPI0005362832|nr:site-specific integrase [Arthrobacter sp. PAMC 25486]AIY01227.1 Integrase [Arthrobacter sp. PAMC 25486]
MASIQHNVSAKGVESWRVVWREPGGKIDGRTFDDEEKAEMTKKFLDANGNTFKLANEAKRIHDQKVKKVHEVLETHIAQLTKPQPGTIRRYRNLARDHIASSPLGNMGIDMVEKKHVIKWMDNLVSAPGSNVAPGSELNPRTKKNIQALLSSAFATAIDMDLMSRNPAKGIGDPDLGESREPVYLSPEDLELLEESMPERYKLFIRTLSKTGLRYNEATALRKRDVRVEGERCIIRVTRAWKDTGDGEEIGPPKTPMAKRNVTCNLELSAKLIDRMKDLKPGDLLFTRPNGLYLRNAYFHKVAWQPVVKELVKEGHLDDHPWIHEIRKAHTTHLLQKGVPVNVVQARLGHEDPQTTLKIYATLTNGDDLKAADLLD